MTSKKTAQKAFGVLLKEARVKLELTQTQVAEKADMTSTYYAMIERGEVNPSLEKLKSLAKVLKIKLTIS